MKTINLSFGENKANFSEKYKTMFMDIIDKNFEKLSLYPIKARQKFIEAISSYHDISDENVIDGCGVKGIYEQLVTLFLKKGDSAVVYNPTYYLYSYILKRQGVSIIKSQDIQKSFNSNIKMIILGNPNNPDGKIFTLKDILNISRFNKKSLIVIDECYATSKNTVLSKKILKLNNCIILKSFSKNIGLAGLRIGYAIANKILIKKLEKKRGNNLLHIGLFNYIGGTVALNISTEKEINFNKDKQYFISELNKFDKLNVQDTPMTFIKINLEKYKISNKVFYSKLKMKNILIKDYSGIEGFDEYSLLMGIPARSDIKKVVKIIEEVLII